MSIGAALATTIGFVGFAYLTNDLADRKKDALAGKSNGTATLGNSSIVILFLAFLSSALLPWLYLPLDNWSVACIAAELMLFVLYAFPPFRLKERGILGVFTDALYAHAIPAFLASWTFYLVGKESYSNFKLFALLLLTWQLLSGIRNIVSHQLKDFENDLASGTRTFVTQIGKEIAEVLMKVLFVPLELISAIFFMAVVQLEFEYFYIGVLSFVLFALVNFRKGKAESPIKHFTNTFLDRFYIHWFPYLILVAVTIKLNAFWPLIAIHLLLFHPEVGKLIRRFNWKNQGDEQEMMDRIAIISTNRNKYSETFIHAHIQRLPNVVVYSDGYFPTSISLDRGATWESIPKHAEHIKGLIASWKANQVKVVLAEYGPSGVEVMEACKKAEIPLVVHFHGFDAYRNDVLSHYGELYASLFQFASKVIVVSKAMKTQLLQLGCPPTKLEVIPYGIDTDCFVPPGADIKRHGFIACGRFVAKKSPLDTIRAFARVANEISEAQLTMIGDGELFEEAILLTQELKIEDRVAFKGVLKPTEIVRELQKHAIFVQHSRRTEDNDSEGTPLSILEAAACGLAIVSTVHAGIPEVIQDGDSGFLVQEGDVEHMAARMIELWNNQSLQEEFGKNARKHIQDAYRQSDYLERIENILKLSRTNS